MSTVRVNLLPPEVEQRRRARRATFITAAALGAWLLVLALLYVLKLGDVAEARRERDQARAEVTRLQAQLDALEPFARLARQVEARNEVLAAAMATEVSWSRVLNDLSLTFPPNSSLLTLSATRAADDEAGQQTETGAVGAEGAIAAVEFSGYSVERYAPGVEVVLLRFDEVRGLFSSYLVTAAKELRGETEVTNFNGSVQLGEEAYTGRYAEGLPLVEGLQ
ncbi:MAG TPA: hypothetical protein VG452_01540 [Egibacteraceae bacterium]|nr:hypothetical protein [Actinomycetota bacterium]HWB70872.1 hypothetical protein [Egibacteraceae bacterium]